MCRLPLFETIAVIDGQPQNLDYHQQRMDQAMRDYFQVQSTHRLAEILNVPEAYRQGLVRCRIDYNSEHAQIHFSPYTPRRIARFQCVYTENLDYRFKYTDRKRLDSLKNLQSDEVVIVNNGWVSDCTVGNLLFLKQGQWFSPQNYLLKGTQLTYLVDIGRVKWAQIAVQDLTQYERIMMVNALNPFDISRSLPLSAINFAKEIENYQKTLATV